MPFGFKSKTILVSDAEFSGLGWDTGTAVVLLHPREGAHIVAVDLKQMWLHNTTLLTE